LLGRAEQGPEGVQRRAGQFEEFVPAFFLHRELAVENQKIVGHLIQFGPFEIVFVNCLCRLPNGTAGQTYNPSKGSQFSEQLVHCQFNDSTFLTIHSFLSASSNLPRKASAVAIQVQTAPLMKIASSVRDSER